MKITVKWSGNSRDILKRHGLEPGGLVQRYIDSEVLRLCEPYVPMQSGSLIRSGLTGTRLGSGEVEYKSPYARYLYYGKLMVGRQTRRAWAKKNETKVVTDKELTYHGAPKRGKLWFERMKADHKKEILHGAAKISRGIR